MSMLSTRMGVSQRQIQSQKLSASQRLTAETHLLALQLDLLTDCYGVKYGPRGKCLTCAHVLTDLEILKGFSDDPKDYTTQCPKCYARFQPVLVCSGGISRAELPFYCALQVLDQLTGKERLNPDELRAKYPAIYHSARVHYGSLRRAFARAALQYPYDEVVKWEEKVRPYLGKLSDVAIARFTDKSVRAVRKLRRSFSIQPARRSNFAY